MIIFLVFCVLIIVFIVKSIYKDIKYRFEKKDEVIKFSVEVELDEISNGVFNALITESPSELDENQILELKNKLRYFLTKIQ